MTVPHRTDVYSVRPATAHGTVTVPGSKSITHRALVLAAASDAPCTVMGALRSADTDATQACLHALGARFETDGATGTTLRSLPAPWHPPDRVLPCANSGTTLRFMTAQAARLAGRITLDGDASLRRRPNQFLLDALRRLGAHVDAAGDNAPIQVRGPIHAGDVTLPSGGSSQYASALLYALALLDGPSTLRLEGPVASAPYLDVTESVAQAFGVPWTRSGSTTDGFTFQVPGAARPRAALYNVEGDWSSAAFPLAAAAITGGTVHVHGVHRDSPQGDRAIVAHLESFGARARWDADGVTVSGDELASPGTVDVASTPDLFPVLAAVAAHADGTTTFTGGHALRDKESDRIAAMAVGLHAMGAQVEERPDGLVVTGGALHGAAVQSRGDHRIHMAFVVAGLAADGVTTVDGAGSVAVSHPTFHADLDRITEAP